MYPNPIQFGSPHGTSHPHSLPGHVQSPFPAHARSESLPVEVQWPEAVNHTDVFVRCFGNDLGRHPQLRDVFSRSPEIGDALIGHYQARLNKAAKQGLTQVVQNIADCLSGVDQPAVWGKPLVAAAENGHLRVVNKLLGKIHLGQNQAVIADALEKAAARGHQPVVTTLLQKTDIKEDSVALAMALRRAAGGGYEGVVTTLLADTPIQDDPLAMASALKEAAQYGHLAVVSELLTASPVARNEAVVNEALTKAASYGHKSVVRILRPHTQQPGLESLLEQIYISRRSNRYSR